MVSGIGGCIGAEQAAPGHRRLSEEGVTTTSPPELKPPGLSVNWTGGGRLQALGLEAPDQPLRCVESHRHVGGTWDPLVLYPGLSEVGGHLERQAHVPGASRPRGSLRGAGDRELLDWEHSGKGKNDIPGRFSLSCGWNLVALRCPRSGGSDHYAWSVQRPLVAVAFRVVVPTLTVVLEVFWIERFSGAVIFSTSRRTNRLESSLWPADTRTGTTDRSCYPSSGRSYHVVPDVLGRVITTENS